MNASLSSLASLQTHELLESDFTSSTSSFSIVPGPGALSGKAIHALGKAVLRGAENLIIRQRLLYISSKFPHTNAESFQDMDALYRDLLELSRVNLYSESVRFKAIRIMLVQIGSQQTTHLLAALSKWPSVEIQLLINELVSILDPIRLLSKLDQSSVYVEAVGAYKSSLPAWESHSLSPFVEFLSSVGQLREGATHAVIQGGALDFLFHAYATGFRDPLWPTDWTDVRPMFLLSAGRHLLSSLSVNAWGLELIRPHYISSLWPTRNYTRFAMVDLTKRDRYNVWRTCEKDVTLWRLLSTFELMDSRTLSYEQDFYDMFVDFLELAGSDEIDLPLSMRALRNLHRMSRQHKYHFRTCVAEYFASDKSPYGAKIISRIVYRIHRVSLKSSPETELFLLPSDSRLELLQYDIIKAFLRVAEADEIFLAALKASDITGLLRHFLESKYSIVVSDTGQFVYQDSQLGPTDIDVLSLTHVDRLSIEEMEEDSVRKAFWTFADFLDQHDRTTNESSKEQL